MFYVEKIYCMHVFSSSFVDTLVVFGKYFPYRSFPGEIGFENVQISKEVEMGIKFIQLKTCFLIFARLGIMYM